MESMTGYGRGEAAAGPLKVTAEARSVNHKGLDLKMRIPAELNPYEPDIRELVRGALSRGSVQLAVIVDYPPQNGIRLNAEVARELVAGLGRLREELHLPGMVDLNLISRFPQIIRQLPAGPDPETVWQAAETAVARALASLKRSRRREGAAILHDIRGHARALADSCARIRKGAAPAILQLKQNIRARAIELAAGLQPDRRRLEEEAALLAARRDFTEEMNRLKAHLASLRRLMAKRGPVGRNLEFLTQEILRELTTIASKAPGNEITSLTIEARLELEKIREQSYNVE